MTEPTGARVLHVANGTSTTRTIAAAGIPGGCSIWADPLHEGPVPDGLSDGELLEVRRQFLSGGHEPSSDPANDLREWRRALERQDSYDELVLWFEHDLFDQLNLIQLLDWIRTHLAPRPFVSLICIGSFPGRPHFKGLGELTPGELGSLFGTRKIVSDPQYQLAGRAWRAFRESTPEALDALRRDETSSLPFVAPALIRFLQEYPWTRDGLSRTERRLLELASNGPIVLSHAFPRMHDGENAYYVTDSSLAALAEHLSRTSPPLITLEPSPVPDGGALSGRMALSDTGRSVLSGHLDRVTLCGLDRWMGGVHLHRQGPLWRWDGEHMRLSSL